MPVVAHHLGDDCGVARGHDLECDVMWSYILSKLRRETAEVPELGPPGSPGVWPVRMHIDRKPVVTDGFQRPGPGAKRKGRGHLGVDIMFRRQGIGSMDRPEYARRYWCPSGVAEAIACAGGRVVAAKRSRTQGWWVKVSHGRYMSVYRHLSRCDVKAGDVVYAGDTIGIVGFAPKAGRFGLNHLHFEIWDLSRKGSKRSRKRMSVDPGLWLRHWGKV